MRSKRIIAGSVVTAGVAGAAALAMALPAQAHGARSVTCDGTIGAQTVGDVVVADNAGCVLAGTTVRGTITVGAGAALDLSDVTVFNGVTAASSGRVAAVNSVVVGSVTSTNSGQLQLTNTAVGGDVAVSGETNVTAVGVAVAGDVTGTAVNRFDVSSSYVLGSVVANEAFSGGNLCGNRVYGDTKVVGSGGAILLGGSASCAGNQVFGNVVVDNNVAFIAIAGNTVKRNLSCTGNDPAPEVGTNTVKGTKSGQCV